MPRFTVVLAASLSVGLSLSRGQEARYVPIPFQGNFENLFKERLEGAKDTLPLQELLNQLKQNLKKLKLDAGSLKQLDLDNPALKQVLKGFMQKHPLGHELTVSELEPLKKMLTKMAAAGSANSVPSVRQEAGDPP